MIRGPGGVGRQLGAEHSQRLESYFQSIPGVQLVACSTVSNAKALLKSAIRSDNPIIFFEHVLLYNVKGAAPTLPYPARSPSTLTAAAPRPPADGRGPAPRAVSEHAYACGVRLCLAAALRQTQAGALFCCGGCRRALGAPRPSSAAMLRGHAVLSQLAAQRDGRPFDGHCPAALKDVIKFLAHKT